MISLPKTKRDPKITADLCKCRPVCKSRRRVWKGELQNTSAELLLERRPVHECFRRWPTSNMLTTIPTRQSWIYNYTLDGTSLHSYAISDNAKNYKRVYPNSPCPLVARARRVTVLERRARPPDVVRICQAPVDDAVHTPYLKFAQMVKNLGAMDAVKSRCPFCDCGGCCGCNATDYAPAGEARDTARRRDMRDFDARVERDYQAMRIMYR